MRALSQRAAHPAAEDTGAGQVAQPPADAEPVQPVTGLPAGLSMTARGAIHGVVTETGTSTVTMSARGADGRPRKVTFRWIVL